MADGHPFEALVKQRLSLSAEEAALGQPEFEDELRGLMMSLEREVHGKDLARFDVDVEGIVVDGKRYRNRGEKTQGVYHEPIPKLTDPPKSI